MAENRQTQVDVAAGVTDRAKSTYTAADATAIDDNDYTAAEEGLVINNNRIRTTELIACLERLGLIEAA